MDTDCKALARRFIEEVWNARRLAVAEDLVAVDCITHNLRSGEPARGIPHGPTAVQTHILEWLAAFPDLTFHIEQMVAENDRVTTQGRIVGTHTGAWLGLPPTGRTVVIRLSTSQRFANGKIAEDWILIDFLGVLQQLEILPPTLDLLIRGAQTIRQRETLERQTQGINRQASASPEVLATIRNSELYRNLGDTPGVEIWDCEEAHEDAASYFWIVARQEETVRVLAYLRWDGELLHQRAYDADDNVCWIVVR